MPTAPRAVYRRADLAPLLEPRSIALIGASPRAGSFGERTLANLSRFAGNVHLVNARYDRIGERPCHPSVSALPEVPDCAVLVVNREVVEGIVEECASIGVRGAVIYASGYAEVGRPERVAEQARLAEMARARGIRIVGPNCIGVLSYVTQARMTFSAVPDVAAARPRSVAVVSQSGALGFALAQAADRGVSFSHVVTCGNSADVDIADWIAALAEDPACGAIACLFEGMPEPRRLLEAAAVARAHDKPVVIHKIGTGEAGAAAALSHTGSLAGSDAAYRAAFDKAGFVVADRFEEIVELADFFSKAGRMKAPGAAVIATSGGASIMAADAAERHGVPLPQPDPAVRAILESHIPEYGSARNPCDVTAQVLANLESLGECAGALLADPAYGAMIYPYVYAYESATRRIPWFSRLAAEHGKPVCFAWLTESLEGPGTRELAAEPGLPVFHSMDRCFAALAAWREREERLAAAAGEDAAGRAAPDGAREAAAALLDAAPAGAMLTEREAKRVLAAYGVPVVEERLARSAEEAEAAAEALGYPVALKAESPDIPHKTEAGVIRLGLADPAAVRAGYETVMANARRAAAEARIHGVLVQPMVPSGLEVVVGARQDPLLGPLVLVGLGGVMAELLRDTVTALAPVTPAEARRMLGRLRGAGLFAGFRGAPAVDLDALAGIVARVSELAADQAGRIAELDVNPLICGAGRIVAVDGLIARSEA
ncbi:acetate--CoA ligase family protein [Roseomonas sp. NAR14]|uniref:Acetate--CoA ligase family protein n=1 Tax=Roseomonas acroporae TaxID=2937791 RepID=A0A9X2BUN6_9PROT|nr:acetate--CoA ligase family protein [Roseomonas acroporae]MCK8785697.1 acetate--CoA ligase family protein [Roseomonas acroporae]